MSRLGCRFADLLRATGRDAEAEAPLRKALAVAPADADAHYALALWLVRQKRLTEARAQVETAARLWAHGCALHRAEPLAGALIQGGYFSST